MQKNKRQGSGLFTVLIIATALFMGVASTINLVMGEFRRNKKAIVYHEAKQAAESLIQLAMADLKDRAERQRSFTVNSLAPTEDPPVYF